MKTSPPSKIGVHKVTSDAEAQQCLPAARTHLLADMHFRDDGTAMEHFRSDDGPREQADLIWSPSLRTAGERHVLMHAMSQLSPSYLIVDTPHWPSSQY